MMARRSAWVAVGWVLALGGCGGSVVSGSGGGSSSSSTSTGGSTATGDLCGSEVCPSGLVCTYFLWSCVQEPHCSPKQTGCDASSPLVCGCDLVVYENACAASAAGVDLAGYSESKCDPPTGMFRCGYTFCKSGQEWCEEHFESGWSCHPLPEDCKSPDATCACLGFPEGGTGGAGGTIEPPADCSSCDQDQGDFTLLCGSF